MLCSGDLKVRNGMAGFQGTDNGGKFRFVGVGCYFHRLCLKKPSILCTLKYPLLHKSFKKQQCNVSFH